MENCNFSKKTVLIVEDNPDILEITSQVLTLEGYNVLTASNGKEALDTLNSKLIYFPSLILLDLMLPIMDGWKFLELIKNDPSDKLYHIPVVITSAASNAEHFAKKMAEGFIKKPIRLDKLLQVVAEYCSES